MEMPGAVSALTGLLSLVGGRLIGGGVRVGLGVLEAGPGGRRLEYGGGAGRAAMQGALFWRNRSSSGEVQVLLPAFYALPASAALPPPGSQDLSGNYAFQSHEQQSEEEQWEHTSFDAGFDWG